MAGLKQLRAVNGRSDIIVCVKTRYIQLRENVYGGKVKDKKLGNR